MGEIILKNVSVIIAIVVAIISWYYSRKSKQHADQSLIIMKQQYALTLGQRMNQYINEACKSFEKEGTPFHYIRSLSISDDEKEEIWEQCFLRYKKRLPKKKFSQQ